MSVRHVVKCKSVILSLSRKSSFRTRKRLTYKTRHHLFLSPKRMELQIWMLQPLGFGLQCLQCTTPCIVKKHTWRTVAQMKMCWVFSTLLRLRNDFILFSFVWLFFSFLFFYLISEQATHRNEQLCLWSSAMKLNWADEDRTSSSGATLTVSGTARALYSIVRQFITV